ncbi:MAG: DnaJ domain-containing protein [Cyanobacteria bacterium Co-bin13]|nr:DnaJ domain-containing protein [Cyanobacteria bacterium Co-bin13]
MAHETHYQILEVAETATQAEIKKAYRRLAKQFHPDSQTEASDHNRIARLNEAYEVLGDPEHRVRYDQQRQGYYPEKSAAESAAERTQRAADMQAQYRRHREAAQASEEQLEQWLRKVYNPIDRLVGKIISPLKGEIRTLSADPFDDELMEGFQSYLEQCRTWLEQAQNKFQSMPNPSTAAGVAANLYHCLNQLEDGIEEMERFTYSYEESYLHTGHELFRISTQLRREAKAGIKEMA